MMRSLIISTIIMASCFLGMTAPAQELKGSDRVGIESSVELLDVCKPNASSTNLRITEFLATANGKEFFELTNCGHLPIDMTGWSYDDNSQNPGCVDLSGLGVIEPLESVILTSEDETDFYNFWGLPNQIKVMQYIHPTLDINDQINIYSDTDQLVDCISYGPADFPGSIVSNAHSAFPVTADIGTDNIYRWLLSRVNDVQHSWASTNGDIGNPGMVKFIKAQEDIGYGGPGESEFWVYGPHIASGNRVDVLLRRAAKNQVAFLFMTMQSNPTPTHGGIVVPAPPLLTFPVITVPSDRCDWGEVYFKTDCGGGPATVFAQWIYVDPDQTEGYGFSNALKLDINP